MSDGHKTWITTASIKNSNDTAPVAAVADALAAVERVRAFVDGFAERGGGKLYPGDELWIMSIRRALDGEP